MDLASSQDVLLSKWDGVSLISTNTKGTLPAQTMGLILGRSSNYTKNFEVLPGVVDANTEAEIKVMVKPLKETIQIHKGQRIAQLLLLPYINLPNPVINTERGSGQFGSSGSDSTFLIQDLTQRPFATFYLNGKEFKGLMDTGADRTCIAASEWPNSWPVTKTGTSLVGLGTASGVLQSAAMLTWTAEGKSGFIQPYVLPSLPFSLWGRDILGPMTIKLVTSDNLSEQHFT